MRQLTDYLATGAPGRGIPAVDVNAGSWYPDQASLKWWPLQDRRDTGLGPFTAGRLEYFNRPLSGPVKDPSSTNLEAMPVPPNEAWYLWGVGVFVQTTYGFGTLTSDEAAQLRNWLQGCSVLIKRPQFEDYRTTLWKLLGPQQMGIANGTPTLAISNPGRGVFTGREDFAVPLVYQANTTWSLVLDYPEFDFEFMNVQIGFDIPRMLVSLVNA